LQKLKMGTKHPFELTWVFLGGTSATHTHLTIYGHGVVLHSGVVLPAVRHFDMSGGARMHPPQSLELLIHLVEQAAQMQTVSVSEITFARRSAALPSDTVLPVDRRIAAPQLQVLTINAGLVEASALIRAFSLPQSALRVTISKDDTLRATNPNFEIVHTAGTELARTQSDADALLRGTVHMQSTSGNYVDWYVIEFGGAPRREGFRLRWSVPCIQAGKYPVFAQLETMQATCRNLPTSLAAYDDTCGLRFAQGLQRDGIIMIAKVTGVKDEATPLRGVFRV
jgi:hypothetical protein